MLRKSRSRESRLDGLLYTWWTEVRHRASDAEAWTRVRLRHTEAKRAGVPGLQAGSGGTSDRATLPRYGDRLIAL